MSETKKALVVRGGWVGPGPVEAGTGLAGWHGGIADSFRASDGYLQLIGGQFAAHPKKQARSEHVGDRTDNDARYTVDVVAERGDHPIVAGLSAFELETEQHCATAPTPNPGMRHSAASA